MREGRRRSVNSDRLCRRWSLLVIPSVHRPSLASAGALHRGNESSVVPSLTSLSLRSGETDASLSLMTEMDREGDTKFAVGLTEGLCSRS